MTTTRGAALVCVIACASGCAGLTWHFGSTTKRYEYDREVAVEVHSDPEGATIVGEDGKPIGAAPVVYHTHHRVERVRKMRNKWLAVGVGAVELAASIGLAVLWFGNAGPDKNGQTHYLDSTSQQLLFATMLVSYIDSSSILAMTLIAGSQADKENDWGQAQPGGAFRKDKVSERVVPRTLRLEARWPDWSPATTTLEIPTHSFATLSRNHLGTFEDAIVRRARAGLPLGPEGHYRAGVAYDQMARETKDRGHARLAVVHLEAYLATDQVPGDRRADVERRIAELQAMGAQP